MLEIIMIHKNPDGIGIFYFLSLLIWTNLCFYFM